MIEGWKVALKLMLVLGQWRTETGLARRGGIDLYRVLRAAASWPY